MKFYFRNKIRIKDFIYIFIKNIKDRFEKSLEDRFK